MRSREAPSTIEATSGCRCCPAASSITDTGGATGGLVGLVWMDVQDDYPGLFTGLFLFFTIVRRDQQQQQLPNIPSST